MKRHPPRVIPSTAAVFSHPLHPMVVVFPIAFIISALASDLAFWWLDDPFWAEVSTWLLAAGLFTGTVAALLGLVDFVSMPEVRRHVSAWSHMLGGVMSLALAAANLRLRWEDPAAMVLPWGLALSGVNAAMVGVTGWLGGTLTFRHAIGTYEAERDIDIEEASDGDDAPPKE